MDFRFEQEDDGPARKVDGGMDFARLATPAKGDGDSMNRQSRKFNADLR
jgi:hypothetical protein